MHASARRVEFAHLVDRQRGQILGEDLLHLVIGPGTFFLGRVVLSIREQLVDFRIGVAGDVVECRALFDRSGDVQAGYAQGGIAPGLLNALN